MGCAQLGNNYGVLNRFTKKKDKYWESLVEYALSKGIHQFDTADSYLKSQKIIGYSLLKNYNSKIKITTKFSTESYNNFNSLNKYINFLLNKFNDSLNDLNVKRVENLLFHRVDILIKNPNIFHEMLNAISAQNITKRLGVSVQSPKELQFALNIDGIELIQLPYNIIDARWEKHIPIIKKKKNEKNLKIHARSIFLQGLLLNEDEKVWNKYINSNSRLHLRWINRISKIFNMTKLELALNFINKIDWIDQFVLGFTSNKELDEIIDIIYHKKYLSKEKIDFIIRTRPKIDYNILDPSKWKNV